MRIWIMIAYEPLPFIDGSVRLLRYGTLSSMLAKAGHDVIWWTSSFDHVRKMQRCKETTSAELKPGWRVNMLAVPGYKTNVSFARIRHNIALSRKFNREVNHCLDAPDIILACLPTLELAEAATAYALKNRVPIVTDVVDIWPDLYLMAFPKQFRAAVRVLLMSEFRRAKRILKSATKITAVSHAYLQWALKTAARERQSSDCVFPLGYPLKSLTTEESLKEKAAELRTRYGIEKGSFIAAFIGQFATSYDLETIVEAAKRTLNRSRSGARIQWVLAGDGDKATKLHELGLILPNVIFTGWLNQISILALLSMSSIGLATYTEHATQSLPYKPFEYMSAGLPIVSSLKGELESILSTHGIGLNYQAGNPYSLVEAVLHYADNIEYCKRAGEKARKVFEEKFSAEAIYSDMIACLCETASLYRNVVSSRMAGDCH